MAEKELRAALEAAKNGLQWYRDMHPEDDSGADDEMMAQIDAALAAQPSAGAEPCSVCNALIGPRNATHYDAEDLAAARVRGRIIADKLATSAKGAEEPASAPTQIEPEPAYSLLRRARTQLGKWRRKYGEHNPAWLPPDGDVRLAEDIDAILNQAPVAASVQAAESAGEPTVTDAMVDAYLKANDAYWKRTDQLPTPPDKWRTGTPREATRESLAAALASASQAERPVVPEGAAAPSGRCPE